MTNPTTDPTTDPRSAPLLVEQHYGVAVLTLNRPDTRNPISEPDVVAALEAAIADINADRSIRALVLTGAGSAFSSGGNVKHMRDRTGMFGGTPAEVREGYRSGIQRILRALYHCEIPTIAAVNGPAIGAGCDIALMCDIRIAATTAVFAELRQSGHHSRRRKRLAAPPRGRALPSLRDGVHRRPRRRPHRAGLGPVVGGPLTDAAARDSK